MNTTTSAFLLALTSSLVGPALLSPSNSQAQSETPAVTVLADALAEKSAPRILFSSELPAADCKYTLKAFERSNKRRTETLGSFPAADGLYSISFRRAPTPTRPLSLSVTLTCGGEAKSANAKITVAAKAKGGVDLKSWVKSARSRWRVSHPTLADFSTSGTFSEPVDLQSSAALPGTLFVVEKPGRVNVISDTTPQTKSVILDVSDFTTSQGERGLLGLALHPNLKTNPYLFLNYTDKASGASVIVRYTLASLDPVAVNANSRVELLRVEQPFPNHNGGRLAFGPDGFLYIGFGDGGSGGDPLGNGQDPKTILGSMLRINVDTPQNGKEYGIPASNPFVGNSDGIPEETYATGFRNPWRYSFDPVTGKLWVADVGQGKFEEIDIVESGKNYGWNIMEGFACYNTTSCNQSGLTLPIYAYGRDLGASVTGGNVYRGNSSASIKGAYLFGDFATGRIFRLALNRQSKAEVIQFAKSDHSIATFGVDTKGELYLTDFGNGSIHRFVEPAVKMRK